MLTKFVDKIMRCIEALLIILLSTAVLIIFMQIIWRYALRTPLGWTEQIARAEFIWMVMLGIPVMFNRGITMSFDIFLQKITGRPHRIIEIMLRIIGLAFCVFYFFASFQLCITTGSRAVSGIKMPYNALYGAQPVCALLLFIVFLKQLNELIRNDSGGEGGTAK